MTGWGEYLRLLESSVTEYWHKKSKLFLKIPVRVIIQIDCYENFLTYIMSTASFETLNCVNILGRSEDWHRTAIF